MAAHPHHCPRSGSRRRRSSPWLVCSGVLLGLASLFWLLLRTGRRPSRITYPCQQAALGNVSLLLALPALHLLRRALGPAARRRLGWAGAALAAVIFVVVVGLSGLSDTRPALSAAGPALTPRADYQATLYVVEDAGGPQGTHHLGVDELLACMGAGGLPFYRSSEGGPEQGPNGIVGAADVVLIKINCQWPERGGTNTDVLKGLISRVLEHPDGFTGEVVVVENTQGVGTLDWAEANAEDHGQSAQDVVDLFAGLGAPVSSYLWDTIRTTSVSEYDYSDLRDGYVIGPYQSDVQMRVSYPKFLTAGGNYLSLKYGIWDPGSGTFDDTNVTFLNVPVLKCHGAVYGVTASVKHHVGTMTTSLSTSTHYAVRYGGLGKFLAEVRMPDLNILDCIYIQANPNDGPWCTYGVATHENKLVAGLDPVALDFWATKNILVPAILARGYTSYPMQDPDNPSSIFRTYLDAAMQQLLAAGIDATNDPANIVAQSCAAVDVRPVGTPGTVATGGACPNPFFSGTMLRFGAPAAGAVQVDVFDVTGRRVRSLQAAAGNDEVYWDGKDESGRSLGAGTYYLRAAGAGAAFSGKATLVR